VALAGPGLSNGGGVTSKPVSWDSLNAVSASMHMLPLISDFVPPQ
jgi:hypothetical protein